MSNLSKKEASNPSVIVICSCGWEGSIDKCLKKTVNEIGWKWSKYICPECIELEAAKLECAQGINNE